MRLAVRAPIVRLTSVMILGYWSFAALLLASIATASHTTSIATKAGYLMLAICIAWEIIGAAIGLIKPKASWHVLLAANIVSSAACAVAAIACLTQEGPGARVVAFLLFQAFVVASYCLWILLHSQIGREWKGELADQ